MDKISPHFLHLVSPRSRVCHTSRIAQKLARYDREGHGDKHRHCQRCQAKGQSGKIQDERDSRSRALAACHSQTRGLSAHAVPDSARKFYARWLGERAFRKELTSAGQPPSDFDAIRASFGPLHCSPASYAL
ncbi:hypothetical protein C8Q70DRAFT_170335 [Cubamyces menziesii]|nr:hypothetical protein C8Q70DRAFT_170335 [Cubamyces menziesii]